MKNGVVEIDIAVLKRHPMNPKQHTEEQIGHIAASIREFGFTQPVVCDEEYTILIGHARTQAAERLGMWRVPVVKLEGLKEAEKLALLLADNQLAQQTTVDMLKQDAVTRALFDAGYDVEKFGLKYEMAQPVMAEGEAESATINQIVVVFEAKDFDEVIRKFDVLREREKLSDYTQVFDLLLGTYERVAHAYH